MNWTNVGDGYTYDVYQMETFTGGSTNNQPISVASGLNSTEFTVNTQLQDNTINGSLFPINYYVIAKNDNNYINSNTVQAMKEYNTVDDCLFFGEVTFK